MKIPVFPVFFVVLSLLAGVQQAIAQVSYIYRYDASGRLVVLDQSDAAPVTPGARVVINEVLYDQNTTANEQEFIELLAVGGTVDISGWTITDQDPAGNNNLNFFFSKTNQRFPCEEPFVLSSGDRLVIWHGRGTSVCTGAVRHIYLDGNVFLPGAGDDLALLDANNRCVDYVAFETGASVNPPPAGCAWTGSNPSNGTPSGVSISRKETIPFSDTDSGGDWVASGLSGTTGPKSPGAANNPSLDTDLDGIANAVDNCPSVANPGQYDVDLDGVGDACDSVPNDTDGDGIPNAADNCPTVSNRNQRDTNGNGVGDACDVATNDSDGDGIADWRDNCPTAANTNQTDTDGDGIGDVCDSSPNVYSLPDSDGDGVADIRDNCVTVVNPSQADADHDGIGNACDGTPDPILADRDKDGIADSKDNCPFQANAAQMDSDKDGIGDVCDNCPLDQDNDIDGDTVCGNVDNCPAVANLDQQDIDKNGIGNACEGIGTVHITEVLYMEKKSINQPEFVELLAVGGPVDMTGWQLTDQDSLGSAPGETTQFSLDFVFSASNARFGCPTPFVLGEGDRLVLDTDYGDPECEGELRVIHTGAGVFLRTDGDDLVLKSSGGECVDYLAYGKKSGDTAVQPPPSDCQWDSAVPLPSNGGIEGVSISRFDEVSDEGLFVDSNSGIDWEASGKTRTVGPFSPGNENVLGNGDTDGDGLKDYADNCPNIANPDQDDSSDHDRIGDACDACLNDKDNDEDMDGRCSVVDNCPKAFNPDQTNSDNDGQGDACDRDRVRRDGGVYITEIYDNKDMPGDSEYIELYAKYGPVDITGWRLTDFDTSNKIDLTLSCNNGPIVLDQGHRVIIWQGKGESKCEGPVWKIYLDSAVFFAAAGDELGLISSAGVCLDYVSYGNSSMSAEASQRGCKWAGMGVPVPEQAGTSMSRFDWPFTDTDSVADWVTSGLSSTVGPKTPGKSNQIVDIKDSDGDNVFDYEDNCILLPNPGQEDKENDGIGDVCDPCPADKNDDEDGDGKCFSVDNCPYAYNPGQADADGDGVGDVCDSSSWLDDGVLINEVLYDQGANEQEFIELYAKNGPVNMTGWRLTDFDIPEAGRNPKNLDFAFAASNPNFPCKEPFVLGQGEILVVSQASGTSVCQGQVRYIYLNKNVFLPAGGDDIGLIDDSGFCQDYVAYGTVTPPTGCSWSGAKATNGNKTGVSISRKNGTLDVIELTDTDSAVDWEASGAAKTAGPSSKGNLNLKGINTGGDLAPEINHDQDGDGINDEADAPWQDDPYNDLDGDGVSGPQDNCPDIPNPNQEDSNADNIGDACQSRFASIKIPLVVQDIRSKYPKWSQHLQQSVTRIGVREDGSEIFRSLGWANTTVIPSGSYIDRVKIVYHTTSGNPDSAATGTIRKDNGEDPQEGGEVTAHIRDVLKRWNFDEPLEYIETTTDNHELAGLGQTSWMYACYPDKWQVDGASGSYDVGPIRDRRIVGLSKDSKIEFDNLSLISMVRNWVINPNNNFGFMLKASAADELKPSRKILAGKGFPLETTTNLSLDEAKTHRPYMVIDYFLPEPQ